MIIKEKTGSQSIRNVPLTGTLIIILLLLFQQPAWVQKYDSTMEGSLKVLQGSTDTLLHTWLIMELNKQFDRRRDEVRKALESEKLLRERQEKLRNDYQELLGPFPVKTPLNPIITGTIECEDYIIEKVAFESRPGFHVTANLYLPKNRKGPFPGVLVPCGHSFEGKALPAYQRVCILLAKNDLVALIVDPICQGERFQFLNEEGQPATYGGTLTHTLLDIAANLAGTDVVSYEAWDNIRAIDYLISRPEVNPEKIGMTGNSGGGTQTFFSMALDDRIVAAAPSCYPATKEIKFVTIGPSDGCQQIYNEGRLGIEETDYLTMRAPKPTRILAAEQDFFDIEGTQILYVEAKKVYTKLGFPDQVDLFSYNDKHGFSKPRREAAVHWMKKWLLNDDTPVIEPELAVHAEKDLLVTSTGQAVTFFEDEKTVVDLNRELVNSLKTQREDFWRENSKEECLARVKQLAGIEEFSNSPVVIHTGTIKREKYTIEKLILKNAEFPVPGLLFIPDDLVEKAPAHIYVNGRGKETNAGAEGEIAKMVNKNTIVLAIDVRGVGETTDYVDKKVLEGYWNTEYRNAKLSLYLGRPLPGQRAGDIQMALSYLLTRDIADSENISITGIGTAGTAVLHAAATDERFKSVFLYQSLDSWMDIIDEPYNHDLYTHLVPEALKYYDLPDLVRSIQPRKVLVIDPVDAAGNIKSRSN